MNESILTDQEKKEFIAQLDSEWIKIWDKLVTKDIDQLKQEALVAYPTPNDRQDVYTSGFRHGYVVGLARLKDRINEFNKPPVKLNK